MNERKALILAEAADLFAVRGFAAVGVHEIGARAGISGGAIYRHFASKEALLGGVLLETVKAWAEAAQSSDVVPDASQRLRGIIEASLALVVSHPTQLLTYTREAHRAAREVKPVLRRYENELWAEWRNAILGVCPELTRADIALRQQAIYGALRSLARRPAALTNPRFAAHVTDGLVSMMLDTAPVAERDPTRSTWSPSPPRREQLIAAAAQLFASRGYHGVGIDDIGKAAGIAGPAVYEHFDSKADLLVEIYDRAGALVVAGTMQALRYASSASDALARLVRSIVEINVEWLDLMIVTWQEGSSVPESERRRLRHRSADVYDLWLGPLRELRPDLSATEATALLLAILPMVGRIADHRRGSVVPVERTVSLVQAFLLVTHADHDASRGSQESRRQALESASRKRRGAL